MGCKECGINYKSLTKSGMCAYCFEKQNGYWPDEFCSDDEKEKRREEKKK